MGKPFRAWPILHAGQHFYVNWQFRQIEQSTVREGGMEREKGEEDEGDILGLLAQLSSIGPHCFGGQVAEQLG